MIVNGVWYAKFDRPINLLKLSRTGYFLFNVNSGFKAVTGRILTYTVTVFNTGTVRILSAPTPERARKALGHVYGIIKRFNAFITHV